MGQHEPSAIGHHHILSTLHTGAGQTQAATAVWGTGSADEEQDILDSMDKIFENARVSGNERLALILPATCRAQMLNTRLYTNVLQSLTERLNTMMSLDVYFTRDHGSGGALGSDALLLMLVLTTEL